MIRKVAKHGAAAFMAKFDHCMLKAACAMAYFGFLRYKKFTVFISASFPQFFTY